RQSDRIEAGLGARRQVQDLIELDEARRVVAVREQDDRLAPDVGRGLGLDLLQVLQRDVERVVERRRSVRRRLADRLFERGRVVGEGLEDADLAVEVDDL